MPPSVNVKRTSGKNMGDVKQENRSLLLTQLYFEGRKSRTSLANELGLTPASITMTINSMIEERIVVPTDAYESASGVGRRQQCIDINHSQLHVVGVTITTAQVRICITDLHFNTLYEDTWGLDTSNADHYAQSICDKVAFGLYTISKTKDDVIGIGVTIRGNVDVERGFSEDSFGLLPRHTQIKLDIEQRIGIPVTVDNHIRSLMICEALHSHTYMENSLFIKYGPGIGSAITIGGRIYLGNHSMAGEIGHLVIEQQGELCRCGKRGCLETLSSFRAIQSRLRHHAITDLGDLMRLIHAGDREVLEVIGGAIGYLLVAVSHMAVLFDPKDIILYGELFGEQQFLELFQEAVTRQTPELAQRLRVSDHNMQLDAQMAGSLAVHTFLESGGLPPLA